LHEEGFGSILPRAMAKKLTLEVHAEQIRGELKVPHQSDMFKSAVEAGYLAARADGKVDATEREVIVNAVELLSQGAVIEWETEALLDDCESRANKDGPEARAEHVGEALKQLGQAEAGLLVAALVARATNGIEKSEAEVLKAIGKAAGLSNDKVRTIVKRASSLSSEAD
jgi:tellurite resistance protein